MKLASNWREIAARAWSFRLMIAATMLSSLSAVFAIADLFPLPPWAIAVCVGMSPILMLAASIARLIHQEGLSK